MPTWVIVSEEDREWLLEQIKEAIAGKEVVVTSNPQKHVSWGLPTKNHPYYRLPQMSFTPDSLTEKGETQYMKGNWKIYTLVVFMEPDTVRPVEKNEEEKT